jgi:hypothetical protein
MSDHFTGWRYIRAMHPYAYRSGQWAEILAVAPANGDRDILQPGDCYIVRFADGATDFWPVFDDAARYEFARDELTALDMSGRAAS